MWSFYGQGIEAIGAKLAGRAWRTILHRGVELRLPRDSLVPADGTCRFDLFDLEFAPGMTREKCAAPALPPPFSRRTV